MPLNIHLIFKTHLDVGFTNYAAVVVKQYFEHYIPNAIQLARTMRRRETADRFIWTTGSWLIYEYLEQANPQQRLEMENAILHGDIAWHALPFTTHSELMDVDLFRLGLSLSQRLDARFGKQTIAAKFTDVPGHTRGIVPLLAEAGVKFLQVGVNGGSAVPKVPPLFCWQDPTGSEIMVMYEGSYGKTFILPENENALAFGHSMDNLGPQNEDEVASIFSSLRKEHPGANVFASTLNAFAERLLPLKASLPVVRQEIGDSWIHGVGSDPVKVSKFRELLRLRSNWLKDDPGLAQDPDFDRFQRKLLLVPEHTWGMDEKTWLDDHEAYSAAEFAAAREKSNFRRFESSWAEQRNYITEAIDSLGEKSLAKEARGHLTTMSAQPPDLTELTPMPLEQVVFRTSQVSAAFDPVSGALMCFEACESGKKWVNPGSSIGLLGYQTFSADDYERFFHQYIRPEEQNNGWSREDFTKPGMEKARPISKIWSPTVDSAFHSQNRILFHLKSEPAAIEDYGCPRDFYLHYSFGRERPEIDMEVVWIGKKACRFPEALWLSFIPNRQEEVKWSIEKLGQQVSPLDVVENGNRHLHACGGSVQMESQGLKIIVESLDAPLVAPGERSLLNFTNEQPDMAKGVHFCLYNNLWGTNFPMWLEDDCKFRFKLRFLDNW